MYGSFQEHLQRTSTSITGSQVFLDNPGHRGFPHIHNEKGPHKALEGMTAPGDCGVGSHPERPAERRNSKAAMDVTEARNRSAVAARLRQALAHAAAAVALAEAQPAGGAAGASAVHAAHGCRSDRRRVRVPRMARHELDEGR